MATDSEIYQLAFSLTQGLTVENARNLIEMTGGEQAYFEMSDRDLALLTNSHKTFFDNTKRRNLLEKARREWDWISSRKVKFLYFNSQDYPQRLLECDDAPLKLFQVGETDLNTKRVISIVGTRHSTPYGLSMVDKLVEDLEKSEDTPLVISGLAYGTDISAHRAALKNNLPTIGVLAHGLKTIYPSSHRDDVVKMIERGGGLITEYLSDDAVHKGNFLARNRIVAGMADCLLLIESKEKGGAMITSNLAAEYNRSVFAVPGRINDMYSEGCNKLITSGAATLVNSAEDIFFFMNWSKRQEGIQHEIFVELSPDEQKIMDYLRNEGSTANSTLAQHFSIPPARLTGLLMELEFKGMVAFMPGSRVMPL